MSQAAKRDAASPRRPCRHRRSHRVATSAESDDAVFAVAVAKRPPVAKPASKPPIPRWLFNLIGHVICCAARVGVGLPDPSPAPAGDVSAALVDDMTQPSIPAVGIDLGTTFSVLARIDDRGRPVTVVNAEGDLLTPSDVLFDGDEVVVGKEALKAIATEADHVAECSKRDVGHRVYHKRLEGKQYPPEVIEAMILNKLRVDAGRQIGPFSKAVITVPAYFDEVRRKATQDAGYMAGFEVLDILNEPTAAAVAFGFQQGYLDPQGSSLAPQHVLVYDLGGGTFDVTVMQIRGTEFNALATDGDVRLGGYDWDLRLVDLVAEQFAAASTTPTRGEDPVSAGKLWRECEDAKRTLSARQKAAVACDHRGVSARIEIAREQFEEATQDLLDRTRFTTVQALKAAGLDWKDLDRVLLVGGSTRMPMVRQMLRAAQRQGAGRLGGGGRGGGPRRRAARLADARPAGGPAAEVQDPQRQLAQPGRGGPRSRSPASSATASSSPATPACRSPASGPSRRGRPASARSASTSSRGRARRPTTARRSAAARSATCRPTCRRSIRWKSSSATSRTGG